MRSDTGSVFKGIFGEESNVLTERKVVSKSGIAIFVFMILGLIFVNERFSFSSVSSFP
jgi:hypothetical protein